MMGALLKWVGIFSIFGATFFMLTDAGTQCVLGYGCDDLWTAMGRLFLAPQLEMAESVDSIVQGEAAGTLSGNDLTVYRKQIIASLLVTVLLIVLFTWLFTKTITTLNATDIFAAFMLSLVTIALLHIVIGYFINGGLNIPYLGFYKLWKNPDVLIGVINYSEVLPLNQTINASGS